MQVKDLHRRALQWQITPAQARARLQEVIDLIASLLNEHSDLRRLRAFAKIRKLFSGYRSLDDIATLSAILNPSPSLKAKQRRVRVHQEKAAQDFDDELRACGRIIAKATGIDPKLGYEIMLRRSKFKPYLKFMPITDGKVTGPKGTIPLEGRDSPSWIHGNQKDAKARAKQAKRTKPCG